MYLYGSFDPAHQNPIEHTRDQREKLIQLADYLRTLPPEKVANFDLTQWATLRDEDNVDDALCFLDEVPGTYKDAVEDSITEAYGTLKENVPASCGYAACACGHATTLFGKQGLCLMFNTYEGKLDHCTLAYIPPGKDRRTTLGFYAASEFFGIPYETSEEFFLSGNYIDDEDIVSSADITPVTVADKIDKWLKENPFLL